MDGQTNLSYFSLEPLVHLNNAQIASTV